MVDCIFTVKPDYCSVCLDGHKLQCLLDHRRQLESWKFGITPKGKKELVSLLKAIIADSKPEVKNNETPKAPQQ